MRVGAGGAGEAAGAGTTANLDEAAILNIKKKSTIQVREEAKGVGGMLVSLEELYQGQVLTNPPECRGNKPEEQ